MRGLFGSDDSSRDKAGLRRQMVDQQLRARGIEDKSVLRAAGTVPRERFVPADMRKLAYTDGPLPIGNGQTISQPYVVAAMSEALGLGPGSKVLEIGTGSGYQTAILAEMGMNVFTIEYIPALAERACEILEELGYHDIHSRAGDGYAGWPEEAPFEGILVTAAPPDFPAELAEQLAGGGNLVVPIGRLDQDLRVYHKTETGELTSRSLFPVRFVPMVKS